MTSSNLSTEQIKERLTLDFNTYPKEVQKAAKYLISNTFEIPLYSIRKISKKALISPSTLVRLVKLLGFQRYDEFKNIYIEDAKKSVSHFTLKAQRIQQQKTDKSFQSFEKFALQTMDCVLNDEVYDKIDPLLDHILSSKNIYILGMRGSFSLAFYLHYLLHMMLPNVNLIRDQEGMLLSEINRVDNNDLVFVFGISPLSQSSKFAINQIVKRQPKILVLTNEIIANIVPDATQLISLGNHSQTLLPSFIPFVAFSEMLVSKLISKGEKRILDYIKRTETELSDVGMFVKPV
jgi:DNA-binding MurR/RpiR family transcriptional regulator